MRTFFTISMALPIWPEWKYLALTLSPILAFTSFSIHTPDSGPGSMGLMKWANLNCTGPAQAAGAARQKATRIKTGHG